MERRPQVVLLGGSLLMEGLAVSLAGRQSWAMVRVDTEVPAVRECLESLNPDLIVFELDGPRSSSILSLLKERPGIPLIGLDLACSRAIVLNSHQHLTPTLNELCRVVQAEAGQQARLLKGGGQTGCNGTTRG